jgi:hypothetical protein
MLSEKSQSSVEELGFFGKDSLEKEARMNFLYDSYSKEVKLLGLQ